MRSTSLVSAALMLFFTACSDANDGHEPIGTTGQSVLTPFPRLEVNAIGTLPTCLAPSATAGHFNLHPRHRYVDVFFSTRRPGVASDRLLDQVDGVSAKLSFVVDSPTGAKVYPASSRGTIVGSKISFQLAPKMTRPAPGTWARARIEISIGKERSTVETKRIFRFVPLGDLDGSGLFDSNDLATAFRAGKYESGTKASACEGDLDGNGVFDTGDLVAANQASPYEPGEAVLAALRNPDPADPKLVKPTDRLSFPTELTNAMAGNALKGGAVCYLSHDFPEGNGNVYTTTGSATCELARWKAALPKWDFEGPEGVWGNTHESDVALDMNSCGGGQEESRYDPNLGHYVTFRTPQPGRAQADSLCRIQKEVKVRCDFYGDAPPSCSVPIAVDGHAQTLATADVTAKSITPTRSSAEAEVDLTYSATSGSSGTSSIKSKAVSPMNVLLDASDNAYVDIKCGITISQKALWAPQCQAWAGVKMDLQDALALLARGDNAKHTATLDITTEQRALRLHSIKVEAKDPVASAGFVAVNAKAKYELENGVVYWVGPANAQRREPQTSSAAASTGARGALALDVVPPLTSSSSTCVVKNEILRYAAAANAALTRRFAGGTERASCDNHFEWEIDSDDWTGDTYNE